MQHRARNAEVDQQGKRVYNGRDERTGHDGRVKTDALCKHRQRAADEFCGEHRYNKRAAHNDGDRNGHTIFEQQIDIR